MKANGRKEFEKKIDQIIKSSDLTREEKIAKLKKWEYDARELQVADDENMTGPDIIPLDLIVESLRELGAERDIEHTAPTKQGGIPHANS